MRIIRAQRWRPDWLCGVVMMVAMLGSAPPAGGQQLPTTREEVPQSSFAPDAIQRRDRERREFEERRRELLEQERQKRERKPLLEEEVKRTPEAAAPEVRFLLTRIEINESKILSPGELRAVIEKYEGREISLGDLQELVKAINQLYADKGFPTAQAILPPQRIREGVVQIQLVEAHIGDVSLEGNRYTRDWYIKQRLLFREGELVDVKDAERQLRRFNRLQDVKAQLVLKPGQEPGTTDYILKFAEPDELVTDVYVDNFGQESTGILRGGANVSTPSLFGIRDSFYLGGYGSKRVEAAFGGYSLPVTRWDTRLGVSFSYSQVTVPLAATNPNTPPPDVDGQSVDVGITLDQPLWVSDRGLLRGVAEGHARESEFRTDGFEFAQNDVRSSAFGLRGEWNDRYGTTGSSQMLGYVVDLHGDDFIKYQGSLFRYQPFSSWLWMTLRANGQQVWAEIIPPAEQIQAGGAFTVRGYPEGFVIGDSGFIASGQMNALLPWAPPAGTTQRDTAVVFGFMDHAHIYGERDRRISSVGLGLNMSWGSYVSQEISVGVPDRGGIRSAEVHFAVHLTPPIASWLGL